jgi:hypothetical protein
VAPSRDRPQEQPSAKKSSTSAAASNSSATAASGKKDKKDKVVLEAVLCGVAVNFVYQQYKYFNLLLFSPWLSR